MTSKIIFIVGIAIMALCVTTALSLPEESDKVVPRSRVSDHELDIALNDQRYLRRQIKCALGEAACDPIGRRLKNLAPLILRGSCPQCTSTETRQIKKVLAHIQRSYPKEWAKVVKHYASA